MEALSTTLKMIFNIFVDINQEFSYGYYDRLKNSLPEGYGEDDPVSLTHVSKEWGLRNAVLVMGYLGKEYSERFAKALEVKAVYTGFRLTNKLSTIQTMVDAVNGKCMDVLNASRKVYYSEPESVERAASRSAFNVRDAYDSYKDYLEEVSRLKAELLSVVDFLDTCVDNKYTERVFMEIVKGESSNHDD